MPITKLQTRPIKKKRISRARVRKISDKARIQMLNRENARLRGIIDGFESALQIISAGLNRRNDYV